MPFEKSSDGHGSRGVEQSTLEVRIGQLTRELDEARAENAHLLTELNQALEHNGPALVDVVVNPQELLIPPTINLEQIRGFTLYMIKAVLNGRGDEIVDLAKTNLFR